MYIYFSYVFLFEKSLEKLLLMMMLEECDIENVLFIVVLHVCVSNK